MGGQEGDTAHAASAPLLTSASLAGLRGRRQGPRGFLRGSARPAASSTVSSTAPRRPALPGSRRILSLRAAPPGASRLRPAPASLQAAGRASSGGGSAGAAAQAWQPGDPGAAGARRAGAPLPGVGVWGSRASRRGRPRGGPKWILVRGKLLPPTGAATPAATLVGDGRRSSPTLGPLGLGQRFI